MKKIGFIIGLCAAFNLAAFSQDNNSDNSSNDDVYYQGDDDQNNYDNPSPQSADNDNGGVTYQTFYDDLGPYGQWVNTPEYGNVWVPNDQNGFTPYLSGGHWVYSDEGWTWVSDYAWGWGPFHYGRWFDDPVLGWAWVPGYDWAPAWVTWGDYGDYYCWAPIWPGAVVGPHYRPDSRYWCFVPHDHIGFGRPVDVVVRPEVAFRGGDIKQLNDHINFISHANTYHQSVFFAGPKANEVEHYTGHKVEPVKIASSNKPGATQVANDHITMYRPAVSRTNKQPAPANVRTVQRPAQQPTQQPTQQHSTPAPTETHSSWTPPRQSAQPQRQVQTQPTRQVQQQQPQRQVQQQPARQSNFIPSSRPSPSPAPSFHPSGGGGGGGGGFHGGGGGGRR